MDSCESRDRVLCEESFKISVLQNLDNQVMYQKKTFPKQSKALENVKLTVKTYPQGKKLRSSIHEKRRVHRCTLSRVRNGFL